MAMKFSQYIGVKVPEELGRRVAELAVRENRSISYVVRRALQQSLAAEAVRSVRSMQERDE
jgi:predicted transcriptional regulator